VSGRWSASTASPTARRRPRWPGTRWTPGTAPGTGGVGALVARELTSVILGTVLLWAVYPYRPSLQFVPTLAWRLFKYGAWIGAGLTILLHDGADPNDAADRSLGWTIHYQDLQDIVNVLWASGAEAIAVNGQRMVPNTAFHYAGVNILVNNASRLSGTYTVTAIGDPSSLAGGLGNPDQLAELKSRSRIYRLGFSWLRSPRLSLPAFDATFLVKYAQPLG